MQIITGFWLQILSLRGKLCRIHIWNRRNCAKRPNIIEASSAFVFTCVVSIWLILTGFSTRGGGVEGGEATPKIAGVQGAAEAPLQTRKARQVNEKLLLANEFDFLFI